MEDPVGLLDSSGYAYLGCSVVLRTKIYQNPIFTKCLFLEVSSPFSLPGSLLV